MHGGADAPLGARGAFRGGESSGYSYDRRRTEEIPARERRRISSRRAAAAGSETDLTSERKKPQEEKAGDRDHRRGRREGTHLLPWGCHTIMELVLAALPVETTGALLRTGATAERAAILFVCMDRVNGRASCERVL